MVAFVNNVGLNAVSRPVLPRSSLQSACGTAVPAAASRSVASTTMQLLPSNSMTPISTSYMDPVKQDITLQTLTYEPMPNISGVEDKDLICYRVWRQVFGNAYVMESERAEAYNAESMYRAGQISVREFVRGIALSNTYRRRFFDCCGPYRAVELNFKHLYGRAPNSQAEVSEHVQIIANEGFEAEINSYIDSPEYTEAFGDDYAPYVRYKGTYPTIEEFNRMCTINSSPGTSDKSLTARARNIGIDNPNHVLSLDGAGYNARLVSTIAMNGHCSFVTVKRALPMRPDLDHGVDKNVSLIDTTPPVNSEAKPVRRVEISMGNYMYLTEEQAAGYAANNLEADTISSMANSEISEAEAQIAALQAKIAELQTIL